MTVVVKGTCTEYVEIGGFDGLTLKSTTGAVLRQPADASSGLVLAPLTVRASRSITIDGLEVRAATAPDSWGILVRGGSADVRLRRTTVQGGLIGIGVAEGSQVSLARVTGRDPGWAAVAAFDMSSVHIEDCLFENTSGAGWEQGIAANNALVTVHGTRIKNMQVGIGVDAGGVLNVTDFTNNYARDADPSDVVIEGGGTSYYGVRVEGGGSLSIGADAKLRILGTGGVWGGDTGGVLVSSGSTFGSTFYQGRNLEIAGSQGQGVFVTNNSIANIAGAQITGTQHAGLVVVSNSTAAIGTDDPTFPVTRIIGLGSPDVFCDSTSLVTGAGPDRAIFATKACEHTLEGTSVPLP